MINIIVTVFPVTVRVFCSQMIKNTTVGEQFLENTLFKA